MSYPPDISYVLPPIFNILKNKDFFLSLSMILGSRFSGWIGLSTARAERPLRGWR